MTANADVFTASDVLLKAASRIEEEGMWCQGDFFAGAYTPNSTEQVYEWRLQTSVRLPECALGALISSTVELGLGLEDFDDAQNALSKQLGVSFANGVASWNDAPGRTAHEVADAMRKAAS